MNITKKATLILLFVTMIWGMTFPLIGSAVQSVDPFSFVFFRFVFAALLLFPFAAKELKQTTPQLLGGALVLGALNYLSYTSQSYGLQTTPPNESAFITSTAVVVVPFFAFLFKIEKPTMIHIASSLLCLMGLYILTGANIKAISIGEIATFTCAVTYAIYIICIQVFTQKITQYRLLAFYQILFTSILAFPLAHSTSFKNFFHINALLALFYCIFMATLLVMFLQTKYQKYVSASKAALLFCLEPVFASLFTWMMTKEPLTRDVIIGGMLILMSVGLSDFIQLISSRRIDKTEVSKEIV